MIVWLGDWLIFAAVSCTPAGYTVVFINGVNNTPEEAGANWRALEGIIGVTSFKGQPLDYYLTYNPSRNIFNDIIDVANQKAIEYGVPFSSMVSRFLLNNVYDPIISSLPTSLQSQLRSDVTAYYIQQINDAITKAKTSDPDLANIVASVSGLASSRAILLVGHSQGTLYANLVYDELTSGSTPRSASSIAVTGAAVVANSIKGTYKDYVTSDTDVIIRGLGLLAPVASATDHGPIASYPPPFPPEDPILLHGFSGIYANPTYSLRQSLKRVLFGGLNSITPPIGSGSGTSCKLVINVNGSHPLWTVSPIVEMSGLRQVNRFTFPVFGTTGNTCGTGERGTPLYSQDIINIPITSDFYESPVVLGAPFQNNPGSPNRRPCSSFVARALVPSPTNIILAPKERYWANATARVATFGGTTLDWEYQLRFDSGDPWTSAGKRCDIGLVPGSNFFISAFSATCTANLVAQ